MKSTQQPFNLLVIGYGNTLRSDDGAGPHVAEAVGALRLPGVRTMICQQLSPEHADPVSRAGTVIFVDATLDGSREVELRALAPNDSSQILAHAADPRTVLALARDVFGRNPQAWWLTVPARNLEFGEGLSPETRSGCDKAVQLVRQFACE